MFIKGINFNLVNTLQLFLELCGKRRGCFWMFKRIVRYGFLGLAFGYIATILLSQSVWLTMRFNTALMLPLVLLLTVVSGGLTKLSLPKYCFAAAQLLILFLFWLFYHDLGVLAVLPAVWLREALYLSSLSLLQGNIILVLLLILANLFWFLPDKKDH